jgi:alpha-amylase
VTALRRLKQFFAIHAVHCTQSCTVVACAIQNPGSSSRDMGDKGSVLVKDKDVPLHRAFEVNLFARTDADWKIRLVLSSYSFAASGAQGPPDGLSDCSRCIGTTLAQGFTVF